MKSPTFKKVALALGATASLASASLAVSSQAHADPQQFSALIAVGSDTTQDITNAFAGFSNGINYTPLQSTPASGYTQIASWNAGATSCITVKTGAPAMLRPNGSTGGRRALSQIGRGVSSWGTGSPCGAKDLSGLVDFARSSSGPATGDTGTDLTYVPFARDALSYGHYRKNGAPVDNMTTAQIRGVYADGVEVVNGVVIVPCGIQTSSGTYGSWNTMMAVNQTTETASTSFCNNLFGVPDAVGRVQEHHGPELKIKGDLVAAASNAICDGTPGGAAVSCANVQVVVGFSASQFVARSNGRATPAPGPGVDLGGLNGIVATTGTAPNVVPNSAFYADTTFGRDVYNVFLTPVIEDTFNEVLQSLFVGGNSAVCTADTTISQLGFINLSTAACGSTSLKGSYLVGDN